MNVKSSVKVYEAPTLKVIGEMRKLTLGGPHSCVDGRSGNVGNQGEGNCNGTSQP